MIAPILALLLSAAAPGLAALGEPEEVEGAVSADLDEAAILEAMKGRLRADPAAAESLAARIGRSTLARKITAAPDEAARLAEIRRWIEADPDSAAALALGLAQDDAEGSRRFEERLNRTVRTKLVVNPNSQKGIFGRLRKSSKDSKLMRKDEEMTDEEQREILKTLFEGKGGQSNKIITQEEKLDAGRDPSQGASPRAALATSYYDRLSQANLRGYSPQLQALQSSLNARRVPGAPRLIETGKLDYETLSYPGHSIRFDIQNLERRLRYERNLALARLLGREREFSPEQLLDPAVEARLAAAAGEKAPPPRLARREAALRRAAAAAREFDTAALAAKDPSKISRELLLSLGEKQREAARWITLASLEADLERIEADEIFMTPELLAAIERAPVDAGSRAAYRKRGEGYKKTFSRIKINAESALKSLSREDWLKSAAAVERLLSENGELGRSLTRDVKDYVRAPFLLAALEEPKPRWRRLLDSAIQVYLPSSAYARRLKGGEEQKRLLQDVFMKIAGGDLDAAHRILAQYQ